MYLSRSRSALVYARADILFVCTIFDNEYIGVIIANIMDRIHNTIACVHIPGLPKKTCYVDHLKLGLSSSRDYCVGGFRLFINATLPFLYSDIQNDHSSDISPPSPLITQQPKKTR